ncbi:hypothetical protein SAICODRAFT_31430 [Saitoella complicata NRRL Y-17804]|nr:uncharacterized protein SAICODRAFT_31430 [Saitoella complicata NRRL Y-17804]ODQ51207.1 hypothetical protein SAICODRAFT_31430 [Saitoella complicata NRRL Y-17804]
MSGFWKSKPTTESASTPAANTTTEDPLASLDPSLKALIDEAKPAPLPNLNLPPKFKATAQSTPAPPIPTNESELEDLHAQIEAEKAASLASLASREAQNNAIHEAAWANCAVEELALFNCNRYGSLWERAMGCHEYSKKFHACMRLQKKTLKAMGYGSAGEIGVREGKIKEHADDLYMEYLRDEDEHKKQQNQA